MQDGVDSGINFPSRVSRDGHTTIIAIDYALRLHAKRTHTQAYIYQREHTRAHTTHQSDTGAHTHQSDTRAHIHTNAIKNPLHQS